MSTIPEKLQASKDGLDALLTYANGVTGQTDTNIGDAIKTLADGYGNDHGDIDTYISNTLTHFRTSNPYALDRLVPGSNVNTDALNSIEYWEIPNNTRPLPVWGYANLTKLIRFDAGYTTAVQNVSLAASGRKNVGYDLILRKKDAIVTLHNSNSIGNVKRVFVPAELIDVYLADEKWKTVSGISAKIHPLLCASTVQEKEDFLSSASTVDGTMVACDEDATYTVKGE